VGSRGRSGDPPVVHLDGKRVALLQDDVLQDMVVFVFNFAEYLGTIARGRQ